MLDIQIDALVLGIKGNPVPTQPWSRDYNCAHNLYDVLAQQEDWAQGFDIRQGCIVLDATGKLIGRGDTQILAMCRAVLAHWTGKGQTVPLGGSNA
jgi:hypothetical protein